MKRTIALAIVCAVASLLDSMQAETSEGKAVVRAIHGSAKYTTGGGVWIPLKVGTTLRPGSTVQTAADSTVDCFLGANGPVVRVTPDTKMAFDRLAITKSEGENVIETELNLSTGRILGNVKKLAAASKYEIKVPNGVAGIRGTDYEIRVTPNGDGTFRIDVSCVTGQIVVAVVRILHDTTAILGDRQTWNSESGGPPVPMTEVQYDALKRELNNLLEPYENRGGDPIAGPSVSLEVPLTSQTGNSFANPGLGKPPEPQLPQQP